MILSCPPTPPSPPSKETFPAAPLCKGGFSLLLFGLEAEGQSGKMSFQPIKMGSEASRGGGERAALELTRRKTKPTEQFSRRRTKCQVLFVS